MLIFSDTFIIGKEDTNRYISLSDAVLWISLSRSYVNVYPVSCEMFLLNSWEQGSRFCTPREYDFSGSRLGGYHLTRQMQDGEFERYKIFRFKLSVKYFRNGIYAKLKIITGLGDYGWKGGLDKAEIFEPVIGEQDFFIPVEQISAFFTQPERNLKTQIGNTINTLKSSALPVYDTSIKEL